MNSRDDSSFTLKEIFIAAQIGDFSLAGVQDKFTARSAYELRHDACGWFVVGYVEDGYFYVTEMSDDDDGGVDQVAPAPGDGTSGH